jgi:cytochrome c-type biogenesis protein CcmE
MKKIHIILLVFIAGTIALLISLLNTGSTYETIAEAKAKPGKFVHVAVKLDKTKPVEYDATKDANYLSFHAVAIDSTNQTMKVIYRNGEIPNLMISERLVLKGKYENDHFECKDVQTKCPSKYKEEMKPPQNSSAGQATEKSIETTSATTPAPTNLEANK